TEAPPISGDPIAVLDPGHVPELFTLRDQAAQPWWLWQSPVELAVQNTDPGGHTDVTPAGGPDTWGRLRQLGGTAWAVGAAADTSMAVQDSAPSGQGTEAPQSLGDDGGVRWHYGIGPDQALGMSDAPPVEYAQAATCVVMNDETG